MTYQSEVLADSPAGYWRLGETSGTNANDEGSGGNDGTYTGGFTLGATGLDGSVDKAVALDTVNGFIDVGNPAALQITGAITLECLYAPNALPAADGVLHCLVSKGFDGTNQGYALDIRRTSGVVYLNVGSYNSGSGDHATTFAITWTLDEPHHIVGKYTGTAWKLYIDGVEVASTTTGTGAISCTKNVYLGAFHAGSAERYCNGVLDEVAIYAGSLSDARIIAHATAAGLYAGSGDPAVVTDITVPAHGGSIALTTDISTSAPDVADFAVRVDDRPVHLTGISGSGSSWALLLGQRWIQAGQTVTVAYSGADWEPFTATAATNDSDMTPEQVRYVGLKFGMFIHFSIATFLDIDLEVGDEDPDDFDPTDLDFDQILDGAVAAGMTYAVLTTKHVGGFSLSPSMPTAHNVTASAWYAANSNRNPVQEFVDGCRSRGLKIGFYLSAWDKYFELQNPSYTNSEYTDFVLACQEDLLTNYGPIDAIWYDAFGYAISVTPPPGYEPFGFSVVPWLTVYNAAKALQPDCLVINNTHDLDLSHSDIVAYEAQIDGDPPSSNLMVTEQCHTPRASSNWFWKTGSSTIESAATIIAQRDLLNARRCSYLLNFPPNTDGQLDESDMALLAQIGQNELAPPLTPTVVSSGGTSGIPSTSRIGGVIQS